jgi:CRP/FNR family transcriptional regulator, cyclic AMP receptor protein
MTASSLATKLFKCQDYQARQSDNPLYDTFIAGMPMEDKNVHPLPPEFFGIPNSEKLDHPNGRVIFRQGDPADTVFLIQQGKVKVSVISEHGKEAVIAILGPDEFVGEACLTGRSDRTATAIAMTDCRIIRFEKAEIISALQNQTAFSEIFVSHLLARNIRIEEDLIDQLFNSSEKRLARALLLLANFSEGKGRDPVIINVTQETLAEMIGTTRSRVSFFMNKFRKLGLIDYNGHVEVKSALWDVVLRDEPRIK